MQMWSLQTFTVSLITFQLLLLILKINGNIVESKAANVTAKNNNSLSINVTSNSNNSSNVIDFEEINRMKTDDLNELMKYMNIHGHPHNAPVNYETFKTVLRFTYGDDDEFGPHKWEKVPSSLFTTNECGINEQTPIDIIEKNVGIIGTDRSEGHGRNSSDLTLIFLASEKSATNGYYFGFPDNTFNGIAIVPRAFGVFQVQDDFDSHLKDAGLASRMYDFAYAVISFCNFQKSSKLRSGHQIEGKRFPLEISLLFFWNPPDMAIDKITFGEEKDFIVMVSILGELDEDDKDNPNLEALIRAAKKFEGKNFDLISEQNSMLFTENFSPSWLLPDKTDYFYYQGNFPIPPCYAIPRIYVLKKPIKISRKQLQVLSSIKSARERLGELSCTLPRMKERTSEELSDIQVFYNPAEIKLKGYTFKPSQNEGAMQTPKLNFITLLAILMYFLTTISILYRICEYAFLGIFLVYELIF